jgi:hypothetical protein
LASVSQVFLRESPKGDQPSLFLTQLKAILGKPLPEHAGHSLGILSILEADDEVISIPDEIHLPT